MHEERTARRFMSCLICLVLLGCGRKAAVEVAFDHSQIEPAPTAVVEDARNAPRSDESRVVAEALPLGFEKIKLKVDGGETAFSLKAKDDGGKLVDASEAELARFNLSPGKLKVKAPDDEVIAFIVIADRQFKLEDASQTTTRWKLQRQADGDWKLEDGEQQLLYKIKHRNYGFEVESATEESVCKVKRKGDKTSLRDASEQTVLYTKDAIHPLALACFGLDQLEDNRLRAGLAVAVQLQYGRYE